MVAEFVPNTSTVAFMYPQTSEQKASLQKSRLQALGYKLEDPKKLISNLAANSVTDPKVGGLLHDAVIHIPEFTLAAAEVGLTFKNFNQKEGTGTAVIPKISAPK